MSTQQSIKPLVLYFLIFLNIFALAAFGDIMEYDAVNWLDYSESVKLGFITGFISATGVVASEFSSFSSFLELDKKISIKYNFDKQCERLYLEKIRVGQIKDGIDVFYKDFSNRRIKIVDAVYVVKMQILGENPELIDAQIRYLKMQPISEEKYIISSMRILKFQEKKDNLPVTYKDIESGNVNKEDLLIKGQFIDVNNNLHFLFRYGTYK